MIKVHKISKPSALDTEPHSSVIEKTRQTIRENLSDPDFKKIFSEKWRTVKCIKEELFEKNHGKCAYCESEERDKRTMDVEHYRPKTSVKDTVHPGYWWLADETDNYLLSCKVCNSDHKSNKFPLLNESARVSIENGPIDSETPMLINPNEEDPSAFIGFKSEEGPIDLVIAVGLDADDRGHQSIKICGLNDDDLCESRGDLLVPLLCISETMNNAIQNNNELLREKIAARIKKYTSSKKSFAGYRRDFFRERDLAEYVADD